MSWTPEHKAELEKIRLRLVKAIDTLAFARDHVEALDARADITAALDRLQAIKEEIKK